LTEADLTDARLENVNFAGADLDTADWERAALAGAKFQRANLSNAKNLEQAQLVGACGDRRTIVPRRSN
jgi:uncharacterized protein YjbI with pentapeptide repeats